MKYITAPTPIDLVTVDGDPVKDANGKPARMTLHQFVLSRLLDPVFGESMSSVLSAAKIRDIAALDENVLALEDTDYELLARATVTPRAAYNPAISHCLGPFMVAIVKDALDKDPRKGAEA